jgi:phospholipid-binding lipoprotein MlaA
MKRIFDPSFRYRPSYATDLRCDRNRLARWTSIALAIAVMQGCATVPDNPDPWEATNRKIFAFNESVDAHVVKPVAEGYVKVTPSAVRTGVANFFGNIADAWTSMNQILQGKPQEAVSDAGRVLVDTTAGLLGFLDVATPLGLEKHDEDLGQTLAVWGVPSGPYLVLPFLGPSTARDGPARVLDGGWYAGLVGDASAYWTLWGTDKMSSRAEVMPAEKVIDEAAIDKYAFIRDGWSQRRRNHVYDGNPPAEQEDR